MVWAYAWRRLVEALVRRVIWMEDSQILRVREREIKDNYKSNHQEGFKFEWSVIRGCLCC